MKKLFVITMFTVFGLASKAIGTDYNAQYLHWIYWVNNPNHVGTADELSEIAFVLNEGNVQPNKEYKLSTGITYKIPMPNLYLSYLVRVYRKVDPTTTSDNVYLKIKKSDETYWDNNLNMTVTNYYFSSVHKEVRSIPNYSGKDDQSPILIYNGYPVIKRDCGNPLENKVHVDLPPTESIFKSKVNETTPTDWSYQSPRRDVEGVFTRDEPKAFTPSKKKNGWLKAVLITVGAAIVTGAVYLLLRKKGGKSIETGGPGGAPPTNG